MEYQNYKSVYEGSRQEIIEKKSRFIATISHVRTVNEAEDFISCIKKEFYDARHNCSAYAIGHDASITKCSDDKEPSGTAGRPILSCILSEGLSDVCIVVTRYFGGILLGTGGLVRAYTSAAQAAVRSALICENIFAHIYELSLSYADFEKIKIFFRSFDIRIIDADYGECVTARIAVTDNFEEPFLKELSVSYKENTSCNKIKDAYMTDINGKTILTGEIF